MSVSMTVDLVAQFKASGSQVGTRPHSGVTTSTGVRELCMNICSNNVVHTTAAARDNDQTDAGQTRSTLRGDSTRRGKTRSSRRPTLASTCSSTALSSMCSLLDRTRISPSVHSSAWRRGGWPCVCARRPAGRTIRYGGDRGTANVRSSLKLNMRLFAISDIHTDYKENLEWIQEHARSRTNGTSSQPRNPSLQDETVLLVAGDVCDDVVQFRKVRHTHCLVGYGRNARVERRAEDGRGPR